VLWRRQQTAPRCGSRRPSLDERSLAWGIVGGGDLDGQKRVTLLGEYRLEDSGHARGVDTCHFLGGGG